MKAIILTYAPVNTDDKQSLLDTNIFKLALNNHAAEYKPDARILTDYILENIYKKFPEKIISVRDKLRYDSKRIEYYNGKFKGSTMLAAIDYLISKKYDKILIVGDNKVNHKKFRDEINQEISKVKNMATIYQYTKGNFDLPVKTITEFCK